MFLFLTLEVAIENFDISCSWVGNLYLLSCKACVHDYTIGYTKMTERLWPIDKTNYDHLLSISIIEICHST